MSALPTMWQFWLGTGWGAILGFLATYQWVALPMARLLGWEPERCGSAELDRSSVESATEGFCGGGGVTGATESLFSLRELQRAVALALVAYGDESIGDKVPQEVWDRLHDEGLVQTAADFTGEGRTDLTADGANVLRRMLHA